MSGQVVKKTVVVGLGNPLMSDEGIGVLVARKLQDEAVSFPDAEFVDAGAAGMKLLHLLSGREKAVLVDCAFMDLQPGEFRVFRPGDAVSSKRVDGFSVHEADLLGISDLLRRFGEEPPEIVFVGIQPESVAPGDGVSGVLSARLAEYVKAVESLL